MLSRRALGVVAAALCAVLLAGCTDDSSDDPEAGRDPGRPLQTLGADGLPADFPRKEIPIPDGEVTSVTQDTGKDPGYAIAVVVDGTPETALSDAAGLLEDAGWARRAGGTDTVVVLRRDGDLTIITSAANGEQTVLSYAIDLAA